MITTVVYLLMAWAHTQLEDFELPEIVEKNIHKAKHGVTAFVAALEGHLLLVFVYPQFYPVIRFIAGVTGFHFFARFYYE